MRTVIPALLMAALNAGCSDCEPPMGEGSPSFDDTVAHVWESFRDSTWRHDVCVASIREREHDELGRYYPVGRRITVAPDLQPALLEETVRHELCHALDLQNDLTDDASDPRWPVAGLDGRQVREQFAAFCEVGERTLDVFSQPECDATQTSEAAEFVRGLAYRRTDVNPPALVDWIGRYSDPSLEGAVLLEADGRDNGTVRFRWSRSGNADVVLLNAETGERAPNLGAVLDVETSDAAPFASARVLASGRWPDQTGDEVVLAELSTPLGDLNRLAMSFPSDPDDIWVSVHGCVNEHTQLFRQGDALWVATLTGTELRWGPIVRWRDLSWPDYRDVVGR